MAYDTTRITIPKSELAFFKIFTQRDIDTLRTIVDSLHVAPLTLDNEMAAQAISAETGIEISIIRPIVSLLMRLALIQRRLGVEAEDLLQSLDFSQIVDQWSETDELAWMQRRDIIIHALSSDSSLALDAKAGELLLEQSNIFCSTRIITDIRPVFNDSATNLQGFVTFHTLSIAFHNEGTQREIRFALDSNDLCDLKNQIIRAETKEDSLNTALSESGFKVIRTRER